VKKDTLLITGAQGFIASNFINRFKNKYNFLQIIKNKKENICFKKKKNYHIYKKGNIINLITFLKKNKPKLVIHFGSLFIAEHKSDQISDLIESNVLFGNHILESMLKSDCKKIINIETSWQNYNNSREYNPSCLYAATKEAFKKILFYYHKAYGFNVINIKLFDTYGSNDKRKKIFNYLLKKKKLNLTRGAQKINLLHVDDVCDGIEKCSKNLLKKNISFSDYGLGSKKNFTLKLLIKKFIKINNLNIKIYWGKKKYKDREIFNPYNKYKKIPGWREKINVEYGFNYKKL
jgi:nucleoside-diphosphate-sugar epimerase